MTMKENLSALIDAELSELDERRVFQGLTDDQELRGAWERYHLIRAAMTQQVGVLTEKGFSDRVMARLQEETEQTPKVPLRFWPLATGFAVAASVATIAILAFQTIQQPVNSSNVAASAAGVSPAVNVTASASVAVVPSSEERLNLYLVGHNEYVPTTGMGGMLPYVRVVTHDQDK